MIKRRFIGRVINGNTGIVEKEEYHHLVNVHRAKEGSEFILVTKEGVLYRARILEIDRRKRIALARLSIMLENKYTPERSGVYVAFALFNENRLRFLLEKATEIGVDGFLPFVSERSKRRVFEVKEGWHKVIEQAVKQSKRRSFPEIMEVMPFEGAVKKAKDMGEVFSFDMYGNSVDKIKVESTLSFVFVGPEGGFTEKEKEILRDNASGIISLGPNTLRTETAAIIGAYELIKAKNKRR